MTLDSSSLITCRQKKDAMRFGSAGEESGDYCSLRDVHLAHYFSRTDVINHLINMGLVRRTGEVVSEKEWRRAHARQQREEREREKEMHRKRLQEAEEASRRRITEKIRRKEARRSLRAALEGEWQRLYILQDSQGNPARHPDPPHPQQDAEGAREDTGQRQSSEEGGVLHFDIVWNYRPVSSTTEGATSSGTPRASDSSSGGQPGVSRHRGSTPDKFLQKGRARGRQRVVGEPYVASLGPNPSPRYLHILRPTNNCREVWARLCPPQPESSRLPRPAPSSPPHMRLVYAGGGAPCPTPTHLVLRQQPAGSHNVTVFQGTVCVGDEINIISMRRANFPFSVTIYENGVSTGRLSACCEHRYAKGSRLGGRSGHLRVLEITGGEPCLRCQLRVVEKRHKARRRVHYKKTKEIISVNSDHPAYTPPETGSEVSSTGEGSSSGTQEEQASDEPKSSDSDMDSPSPTSSNHLSLPEEQHSPTARRRHISSDSCNGPSDQEVAEVLGVGTITKEQHGEDTLEETALTTLRPAEDIDAGERNSWEETMSGDDDNQESLPRQPASNNDYEPSPSHQVKAMSESDSVQAATTEVPPLLASYSYGSSWEEEEEEDNDKEEQEEEDADEEEDENDKEQQNEEVANEEEQEQNDKEEQEEEEEEEYNDKEEQEEEDVEEEEETKEANYTILTLSSRIQAGY
ncbi:glutamate-rich protein 3-like [Portunus trituberculatus]|uniref:glutamate-rich protein 3-like n=1 Tax=Portunus trituberculatus TaxID=210409 RepID=UPI001E1CB439|nr:glutamate-rich protein 3-like [Portunus trituberculatus]